MSEDDVKSACLDIVTTEGKPLIFLDCAAFRTFVDPIFKALNMNVINSHTILGLIDDKYGEFVSLLKTKLA